MKSIRLTNHAQEQAIERGTKKVAKQLKNGLAKLLLILIIELPKEPSKELIKKLS